MRPTTLKEAVNHAIEGYGCIDAISEFLDEFYPGGPSERQRMIGEEPGSRAWRSRMPTSGRRGAPCQAMGAGLPGMGRRPSSVPGQAPFPRLHGAREAGFPARQPDCLPPPPDFHRG